MRLIDADMEVTAQLFDDMYEEYREVKMPISVFLDIYTNEGCPSAEKQGEWIGVTNGRGGHECSNCHDYAPSYMSGDEHLSDYCPSCGAKMFPTQMSER